MNKVYTEGAERFKVSLAPGLGSGFFFFEE